jgi:hypothetical protein
MNDPVVEEVRKVREEYAARFNYDIAAICKDLREQGKAGGYEFVSLPPKRVESKNR